MEAALRDSLIDPQSAQIEWPYNFTSVTRKPLLGRRLAGWSTCGLVNARNRMGGYTGKVWFQAMINSGRVIALDVGSADGLDPATVTCLDMTKRGLLSPAPAVVAPAAVSPEAYLATAAQGASDAAARGGLGITFQATVHGALIAAVAPGSPAERGGLKAGEVIETVNGIAIRGFDQATMVKIFAGAGAEVILDVVGIGRLKVNRPAR
jgi:predicted metalloprotease with PDZ domain